MKRNRLNRPGQGPASGALPPKVSSHLCAPEGSNALAGHRMPAASHLWYHNHARASVRLFFKARGRESDFQEQKPSGADGARAVPARRRLGHAQLLRRPLPAATALTKGEPRYRGPSAWTSPSIAAHQHLGSSRAASPVLNTERQGTNRKTGCGKGRQRQRVLFLSTPAMMFHWSSQA